jgi:hypothetical protein
MKQTEWSIQKLIHVYLSKALPRGSFAWAVDHAQKTTEVARMGMAARGIVAGIPDHFIIHEGKMITLEIKAPGNYPTESQREFGLRLQNAQAYWFVVRSCEDVESALRGIGVPLNATIRIPAAQIALSKPMKTSKTREPRASRAAIAKHMRSADAYLDLLRRTGQVPSTSNDS